MFEIIENTEEAREEFGTHYGVSDLFIDREELNALLSGKTLATTDGEYSTFITLYEEETN